MGHAINKGESTRTKHRMHVFRCTEYMCFMMFHDVSTPPRCTTEGFEYFLRSIRLRPLPWPAHLVRPRTEHPTRSIRPRRERRFELRSLRFRSEGTTTYFQTTVGATFGNLEA